MMRALSMLPLPLLYAAFGVAAWFLRIVGWRRRLVIDALERCLPALGPPERQLVLRAYYRYLGELTAEVLHAGRISREDLEQRVHIENPEVVQQALREGRRVMLLAAHHCNWEWLLQRCSTAFDAPLMAAYKPASRKYADRSLRFVRTRFGAEMIPAKEFVATLLARRGRVSLLALLADQSPAAGSKQQAWLSFFDRDTAFFLGPGVIGAKLGYLPVFIALRRKSRGQYAARLMPLVAPGQRAEPAQILAAYVRVLEEHVREFPEQYFWAYNRWKRQRRTYE
jgi:KDO2-lipid IV(A) lauroyltransferase